MVQFTENGISIGGRELPLYSGAVHYWRMNPADWLPVLHSIRQMGFAIVETYIPWAVHETAPGVYDFGEGDKSKDLDGFLRAVQQAGLYILVRPGPHINAEMTNFGYPEWILQDEEIQARTPAGTACIYPYATKPFPIPSYASRKLFAKTREYFGQLAPFLRGHQYPAGPIVAVQADNETCYFFRDRPYVLDYSRDAVAQYRDMLANRYGTVQALNAAYGTSHAGFADVAPPTGYDESNKRWCLDWVAYKEYQILQALGTMVEMLEETGVEVPLFHNCAYQHYTPISVQRDEQIPGLAVAGIDAYPLPGDTAMLAERIRYLAGSSRLPFVPEFGCGRWFDSDHLPSGEEQVFGYRYAFMRGLRAINYYMLVERDRWTGCPITQDGRVREEYRGPLAEWLAVQNAMELHLCHRRPRVLVLQNYAMGRLKAMGAAMDLNTLSSNIFVQGPDVPPALLCPEAPPFAVDGDLSHWARDSWVDQVRALLEAGNIEYDLSDEYIAGERLAAYDVVFASAWQCMAASLQQRLTEHGGQVVAGPRLPGEDEWLRPCDTLALWAGGRPRSFHLCRQVSVDLLAELGLGAECTCSSAQLELSLHHGPGHQVLYVANPGGQACEATVALPGPRDAYGEDGTLVRGATSLSVALPAHTVKLWKLEKGAEE